MTGIPRSRNARVVQLPVDISEVCLVWLSFLSLEDLPRLRNEENVVRSPYKERFVCIV